MKKLFYNLSCMIFISILYLASCSRHSNKHQATNINKMGNEVFKGKVVVILSKPLDMKSSEINIQDYFYNGKPFIPFFSSVLKFTESTKGAVKNPTVEIEGMLLLSLLKGNEILKLNPGLNDEASFQASELMTENSTAIEQFQIKMKRIRQDDSSSYRR